GLGAIPIVGGLFAALRAALAPAATRKPERIPLCRLDQIPEEGIVERALAFQVRRGPSVENVARVVFVTRDPQTKTVLAMAGECTHLSCPVHLRTEPGGPPLQCPCHGGKFSPTGEVLDGPPPRPLRRLQLELPPDGKGMIHVVDA
ncbi:MAG TPA: Rieske 2Fe-2S domain-containing protein, partial [Planctomycetota bacterium]|nr:Rieske 2Fe-2S domain-containing protein [Planctomycetota bacterium]